MPSAPFKPMMTLRTVAPFSIRNTGSCPSAWPPSPSASVGLYVRQPPSYTPAETTMVWLTVTSPVDTQVEPVISPPSGGGGGGGGGGGAGGGGGGGETPSMGT